MISGSSITVGEICPDQLEIVRKLEEVQIAKSNGIMKSTLSSADIDRVTGDNRELL